MRYVMRIAELSESSNLWTQIALSGQSWEHTSLSIGFNLSQQRLSLLENELSRFSPEMSHFKFHVYFNSLTMRAYSNLVT